MLIVGGGVSGRYFLSKAGKEIAIVEDGILGSGEAGYTTAHITNALMTDIIQ